MRLETGTKNGGGVSQLGAGWPITINDSLIDSSCLFLIGYEIGGPAPFSNYMAAAVHRPDVASSMLLNQPRRPGDALLQDRLSH